MHKLFALALFLLLALSACVGPVSPTGSSAGPAGSDVAMPNARQQGLIGR